MGVKGKSKRERQQVWKKVCRQGQGKKCAVQIGRKAAGKVEEVEGRQNHNATMQKPDD